MRVKQSLPRSKAKEKVLRAPNKPQIRRCAVKLRRVTLNASKVNGVASEQNENCKPLLLEQQIKAQKNSSKVNKVKRRPNETGISQPKLKKCVVKIKRIHLNGDAPKKLPTAISRNPALALTSRRAKELGVKNSETKAIASESSPAKEAKNSKQIVPLYSPIESTSPRNLAKKTSIIAELLFSEDEELLQTPNGDEQNISSKNTGNQTTVVHKFFHKDHKYAQQNVKKTEKPINPQITNNKRKRHVNPKLKTQPRPRRNTTATPAKKDIYEFLSQSQSQTSDSDGVKGNKKDVASDIIKKLIDEGKVVVTKNVKGRPRAVRKHTKNQKNKMKISNKNVIEQKQVENDNIFNYVDDDDFGVGNHNDENEHFEETTALPVFSNKNANTSVFSKPRNEEEAHTTTANSTFSELARSVLVRKAEKCKNIADGKTALEILQRWNSTPFKPQHKSPQLPHEVNFSPIQSEAQTKTNALTLPNRSNNELFETSNIELPSTSNSGSNKKLPNMLPRNTNIPSSFSSNDSNAENQPPPPQPMAPSSTSTMFRSPMHHAPQNENDLIHNARQIPNPRRALQHRSPLKAINIIDIVTLPPYIAPSILGNKTKSNENEAKEKSDEKSKLFGFEEYLDGNSLSDDDPEKNASHNNNMTKSTKSAKLNISKQLRKLKRLRPRSTSTLTSHSRSTITKNIFDEDDAGIAGKRRGNRGNIKEMLCSTMVSEKQSASTSNITAASVSDSDDSNNEASLEKKTAELFGDPETTFDQKSFRRTYERPLRRKRKLIHEFSDIFESDHENSDDEEDEFGAHEAAKGKARKAKKRHVESPQHEELDNFVTEFNSMLKEAEDYVLVVE